MFKDIELVARNQVNLSTGTLEKVEMLTVPQISILVDSGAHKQAQSFHRDRKEEEEKDR